MKRCCTCKKEKDESEFSWKSRRKCQRASECKECHKKMRNLYYKANKDKEIKSVDVRKNVTAEWLRDYKNHKKCARCDENHIAVLQFHHRDPTQKDAAISQGIHNMKWGLKRIQKEIEKCDILCANCHIKLHYELKQSATV